MKRALHTGAAILLVCSIAAATPPSVTIVSPCECRDNHGKGRWAVKNDASLPPTDASALHAVTPSDMYGWPGIGVQPNWQSERTERENNWYSLTGRIIAIKVEADGDLHLALQDATGDKPGIVVCEIPARSQWVRCFGIHLVMKLDMLSKYEVNVILCPFS